MGSSLKSPNRKGALGQGMHLSMVAPSLPRHHDSFLSIGAHAPVAVQVGSWQGLQKEWSLDQMIA